MTQRLTLSVIFALVIAFLTGCGGFYAAVAAGGRMPSVGKGGEEICFEASEISIILADGKADIRNSEGRRLELRDGAGLYGGYTVCTGDEGVNLMIDDDRMVSLEPNSRAEIKKAGKGLVLIIKEGEAGVGSMEREEARVRNSTMTTGLRG